MSYLKEKMRHIRDTLISRKFLFSLFGFLLLITAWHILSLFVHNIVIAPPYEAFRSLYELIGTEQFQEHFMVTIKRLFTGIIWGGLAGFMLGLLAGINKDIKNLLEPMRWALMSVPPVVVVLLAMLWFGMGSTTIVFVVGVVLLIPVYINTLKGMEVIDEDLLEMSRIYKLSLWLKLRHIYIPAITGYLLAAMVIVTGQGVRIVILAEVLGASEGIGYALSIAGTLLNTPEFYAYIIVGFCIVGIAEFLVLRPIQNYALRWKRQEQ